jgi:hypothetical protein
VEVQHGDKRRTFVVEVRAVGAPAARSLESGRPAVVADERALEILGTCERVVRVIWHV